MKILFLLGTLFLSGFAVLAEDFLYLECSTVTRAVFRERKTQELINEQSKDETLYLKIDIRDNRFMSHKNSTWDEAKIDGSKLKAVINKRENGLLATGNLEIDIDPAGQFNSEMNFTAWAISIKMDINGQCIAVDESVFNQMK